MTGRQRRLFRFLPFLLWATLGSACGQVSAPIPPEDVGIEAKVREQQRQAREQGQLSEDQVPIEEETVELPALRPIGTR